MVTTLSGFDSIDRSSQRSFHAKGLYLRCALVSAKQLLVDLYRLVQLPAVSSPLLSLPSCKLAGNQIKLLKGS